MVLEKFRVEISYQNVSMHIITRKQEAQDYYGGKNKIMPDSCTPINETGRSEIHIHKPWHLKHMPL